MCWQIALGASDEPVGAARDGGRLSHIRPSYRFIKSLSGCAETKVGNDLFNGELPTVAGNPDCDGGHGDSLHPDDYTRALAVCSAPPHDHGMVEVEVAKWKQEWVCSKPYLAPLGISEYEAERDKMPPSVASSWGKQRSPSSQVLRLEWMACSSERTPASKTAPSLLFVAQQL